MESKKTAQREIEYVSVALEIVDGTKKNVKVSIA